MAQVLKEEVKNRILESAIIEFKQKGFENASMRQIALRAGMTVGNLYRYFQNKENLFGVIVDPIFNTMNYFMVNNSNSMLDLEKDSDEDPVFASRLAQTEAVMFLHKFNDFIIQQLKNYGKDRIYILLMRSRGYKYGKAKQDIAGWIHGHIRNSIKYRINKQSLSVEDEIFAKMLSSALIEGLCVMLNEYTEKIKINDVFQRYIQFFML